MNRRTFLNTAGLASASLVSLAAIASDPVRDKAWQRDGAGWRARIGVLTPDNDPVPESEFWTMAPDGVSVHAARIPLTDTLTFSAPPRPDEATTSLASLPVQAIVFAFTTSSYVLGQAGERDLKRRLEKQSKGAPVLLPCIAAVAAFRALTARRIALIHPPWFTDEVVQRGAAYFKSHGFEVVHTSHLEPTRKFTEVTPAELYEWVRGHVTEQVDGVFIGGNGMRAIGAISALEQDLGAPVLTANQVAFWHALQEAKVHGDIEDYGRVFEKTSNIR